MKIDVVTLFPEMIEGFINESIIKRAIEKKLVEIHLVNFRDWSHLSNNQVDDTPYGGGAGMVIRCEAVFECIESLKTKDSYVIMMTPDGKPYKEEEAKILKNKKHLILLCGHYEGFDERIRTLCDAEISIGDYILTGGELPACVIVDSVVRLLEGAITSESLETETFENHLLDYPVYTKPSEYRGLKVPDVLLSGDHKKIAEWRESMRIKKTKEKRPDLLEK